MWKDMVQNYLSWSASERRGIIALILLILVSGIVNKVWPGIVNERAKARFERLEQEHIQNYEASLVPIKSQTDTIAQVLKHNPESQRTIETNTEQASRSKPVRKPVIKAKGPFHLNSCAVNDLLSSGLMHDKFAYRIVRFRDSSGGFYAVDQVRDIYEMTDSLYQLLIGHLFLDSIEVRKLNVNSLSAETLKEHPYISPGLAKQIVGFREKVRPFGNEEDLLQLYFMDTELMNKLRPYVVYQ